MTTTRSLLIPLMIAPGVQPSTEKTNFSTTHFVQADKIRFRFGFPQKIGGWNTILLSQTLRGLVRSIFSAILTTAIDTMIGSNSNLYVLIGSSLTDITPFDPATATTIANSLFTDYYASGFSNPITTVNGSTVITILDASLQASYYAAGDIVTISGATAFNGLSTGVLNAQHVVHAVVAGGFTIVVSTAANASGTGGGGAVVVASGLLLVAATAHGLLNGERVALSGAATFGGITNTLINVEFIARVTGDPNVFGVFTTGTATSHVVAGGGASTSYKKAIAAGNVNQSFGQGYGCGYYGVGLYGTALLSSAGLSYPRIWFFDRFGTNIIMTPGNQGGLYAWTGSTNTAPALITNAPTTINYAFVSNNIIITFGAGGIPNRIFACDQGAMTQWTSSSSNQVFDFTVSGAGRFKSHVSVGTNNLIFSDTQTYLFSYTGYTAGVANGIWQVQQLENNIGLIGPMARCAILGTAYWMGQNNFYEWNGGEVTVMPSADQEASTILNYVFQNINRGQSSKFFAYYNEQFDEIEFHYCSAASNECDRIARFNRTELTWTPDTIDRTAAEYPNLALGYPRLASPSGVLYAHEQGTDADGVAMPWSISTNLRGGDAMRNSIGAATGKTYMLTGIVPDSVQSGNINLEVIGRLYPQSLPVTFDNDYTIAPTDDLIPIQGAGRLWQHVLSGEALGQQWIGGQWQEFVQESSPQ